MKDNLQVIEHMLVYVNMDMYDKLDSIGKQRKGAAAEGGILVTAAPKGEFSYGTNYILAYSNILRCVYMLSKNIWPAI